MLVLLLGVVITSLVEYVAGFAMDKAFGTTSWDYRDKLGNLHGRICLQYSCCWGLLALVMLYVLNPVLSQMAIGSNRRVGELVLTGLIQLRREPLAGLSSGDHPPGVVAAIEAPTQLTPGQLSGTDLLPHDLPLSARMERTFLDRCRGLSTHAQTLMLLASADDSLHHADLQRAGRALGVGEAPFAEVERAGLLQVNGDHVGVRHPLIRSAIYQAATFYERRPAHAALADALGAGAGAGAGVDSDRRIWQLAVAADGSDEAVADHLVATGDRAEDRGGHESASWAYERAAELSIRDDLRARRLFAAARNAYAAGRTERTDGLLTVARAIADERPLRVAIDRLRGRIEVAAGSAVDAHRIFITAARDVAAQGPVQALEMAAYAGVLRSHGIDSGAALAPGTLSTRVEPDDPPRVRCLKLLLETTDRDAVHDWGGAIIALRAALGSGMAADDRDVWANLGNMALHLGDDAAHRSFFSHLLAAARADGAVMEVLYALRRLCFSQYAAGDWSAVRRSADEAVSLARSIGQPAQTGTPLAWLTLMAALQGREAHGNGRDRVVPTRMTPGPASSMHDHLHGCLDDHRPVSAFASRRWRARR